MKRVIFAVLGVIFLAGCQTKQPVTGSSSNPSLGWLFLEKGPYTLTTRVEAAPGPATIRLVRDLSLMSDTPDVVFGADVTVAPDSTISVDLGSLEPGFYEVRLRDSVRWNIGVRPDDVISPADTPEDFDAFWEATLSQLDQVPLEATFTEVPA